LVFFGEKARLQEKKSESLLFLSPSRLSPALLSSLMLF